MLREKSVMITAIIVGGMVTIFLFAALVALAFRGADAAQIMAAVSLILNAILLGRLEATRSTVAAVQQQTNGTQSRLIEAAINSTPSTP